MADKSRSVMPLSHLSFSFLCEETFQSRGTKHNRNRLRIIFLQELFFRLSCSVRDFFMAREYVFIRKEVLSSRPTVSKLLNDSVATMDYAVS